MDGNNRQESLRIALFTYSTKPRGGVVHTLELAEHIQNLGHDVHIFALGKINKGFFVLHHFPILSSLVQWVRKMNL